MRSMIVPLLSVAIGLAVGAPAADRGGAGAPACEQMTTRRLLQNPRFAKEWSDAVRSGDPAAVARMNELVSRLRALHGCDGEDGGTADPGHVLPPGHPPLDGDVPDVPGSAVFEEPSAVAI